ncbi:hypothetical protein K470DRAFT_255611 [Piedraia hortae CBS 480.64]|uniref:Uncharacterized protein n=1 Tax=Piedraia hortae CBS 480.64 TaxID=1314780 RepID=A0A6A7C516_9PEZI|nr:hypothetical protein K470DRAFT_255611 [Piedraia hortae CBS 480.64]
MAQETDVWKGLQNWALFVPVVVGLGAYYSLSQRRQNARPATAAPNKRSEREVRSKSAKKEDQASGEPKKRKAPPRPKGDVPAVPSTTFTEPEREDMSTKQFAARMAKAKQGTDLSAPKGGDRRVKTVKQGKAVDTPVISSASSADEATPYAGNVNDMLEPAAPGPSVLKITPPTKPAKEKAPRQKKEEPVETKKQRQNRQKKEQEKAEREQQEQQRRVLEEQQRRIARESRGEPAKNGVPAANAWKEKPAKPVVDGPLLDTFDESSVKAGAPAEVASSDGEPPADGWTVAAPKGKKKKGSKGEEGEKTVEEAKEKATHEAPKDKATTAAPTAKWIQTAKPNGYTVLGSYKQRIDVDASDPSNWDP